MHAVNTGYCLKNIQTFAASSLSVDNLRNCCTDTLNSLEFEHAGA